MAELAGPDEAAAVGGPGAVPVLRRAGRAVVGFWFRPMGAATYVLFRSALAVTVIAWMLSLIPDLWTFFSETGLRPDPVYSDRYGLFRWFHSDTAILVVYAMTAGSAVAVLAGRAVRLAGPLMWLGIVSFQLDNTYILNAGDELLRVWCAYFAIFALVTPSAVSGIRFGDLADRPSARVPPWLIRIVQIQMTVIYPASFIAKLDGDTWHDGTAALYALQIEDFQRFWVPDRLIDNLVVGDLLTYSTLALEALIPILLWVRPTRRVGIVAGMGLHLGFDYAMRLGFFAWSMTIGYIAFLKPSEAARILRWLRLVPAGRDDATAGADAGPGEARHDPVTAM